MCTRNDQMCAWWWRCAKRRQMETPYSWVGSRKIQHHLLLMSRSADLWENPHTDGLSRLNKGFLVYNMVLAAFWGRKMEHKYIKRTVKNADYVLRMWCSSFAPQTFNRGQSVNFKSMVHRPGLGSSACCWSWKGSCFLGSWFEKFPSSACRGCPAAGVNSALPRPHKTSEHSRDTQNSRRMTFKEPRFYSPQVKVSSTKYTRTKMLTPLPSQLLFCEPPFKQRRKLRPLQPRAAPSIHLI